MSGIYELNYQISMKKIMFRKFALDCTFFFLISIISASTIVWVFQAVNFLDLMVEDGRDFFLYLNYTFLNFPKIVSKLLPFALFFSFFYVISKYELNNELIIFWNFGISKIQLINFVLKVSLFFMVLQILLVALIVPKTQNISRDLIKKSNVNFFESFIKPRKFNDNIKGLTIFAEDKNNNEEFKNVVLILSDDHRYDFLGFHQDSPDFLETPNFDRMFYKGAHMENAFVTTSLCSPSRYYFNGTIYASS